MIRACFKLPFQSDGLHVLTNTTKPAVGAHRSRAAANQSEINLAVSLYSGGKLAEAQALLERILRSHPTNVVVLNIAAACSIGLGKKADAEAYWLRAIAAKPDYADAHNNLGCLFQGGNRLAEAEAAFRRAAASRADYAEAHFNLGCLLTRLKRLSEAELALQRAIASRADYAAAHYNLGCLLVELKRSPEAEAAFRRALAIRPDYTEAHNNLGHLLQELKRFAEAEAAYGCALAVRPDYADAHNNLGCMFKELTRFAEAEAAYRRALAIRPDYAEAHNNLGFLCQELKRFPEAEAACRRALAIRPDYAEACYNLGRLLAQLGRAPEAEAAYRHALAIRPDYPDASWNLGLLLLYLGRWSEGWPLYEFRCHKDRKQPVARIPALACPQWRGESLQGKSLLIWPEQGFGDAIQFVRYLPLLKAQGAARITLVCEPALRVLFQSVAGADAVVTQAQAQDGSGYDFWTLLLSIPLHVGTTLDSIPDSLPYLSVPTERLEAWRRRLPKTGIRVGLVWKGNAGHNNDSNRSLPNLAVLAPLWQVPGINFISLQKGQGEDEAVAVSTRQPMLQVGPDIEDFADSAAIVAQLDLVISVDTALAHLAAALGKPCWVLLPRIGTDWRWLDARSDSPWYPKVVRLFRQQEWEDWSGIIDEVAVSLARWPTVAF